MLSLVRSSGIWGAPVGEAYVREEHPSAVNSSPGTVHTGNGGRVRDEAGRVRRGHLAELARQHDAARDTIETTLGRPVTVAHSYRNRAPRRSAGGGGRHHLPGAGRRAARAGAGPARRRAGRDRRYGVGPVVATGATAVVISGSRVEGPVSVMRSAGPVSLSGNQVSGSVALTGNRTGQTPQPGLRQPGRRLAVVRGQPATAGRRRRAEHGGRRKGRSMRRPVRAGGPPSV
jgi:hypothetical protein